MKLNAFLFSAAATLAGPTAVQSVEAQGADTPGAGVPAGSVTAGAMAEAPLYRVVDGDRVDADTLKGWKTWRAVACDRCHGPNQEGLVGPSLVASLKVLTRDDFKKTVLEGRIERGMPNFSGMPFVAENIDRLYAYLKGRSDGAIKPGKLAAIE